MENTTTKLLDAYAQHLQNEGGAGSDYQIANELGLSKQRVSEWRRGVVGLGFERANMICDIVWPEDEAKKDYWLARLQADREKNDDVKSVWLRLAERASAAVFVVALMGAPLVDTHAQQNASFNNNQTGYILCAYVRR